MIRQVVVSVISLILVVGVVIGIICSVSNDVRKREQQEISQQQRKAVTRFCVPAEFKDTCINTLNGASTYDPQLLLKATIYSAETAMRNLFNLSEALLMEATNNKDNSSKMDLEDCKETLQFAIDDLNTTWSTVADNELHSLHTRTDDMMAWLNAAVTYQHTCLDGFEVETNPFSEQMRKAAIEPTQLTANALSIVKDLTTILGSLGVTIQPMNDRQPIKNRRRLLQAANDGYPSWFSAADRKLLVKNEWTPNAVVAQDGSGDYKTIQEALDAYPKDLRGRYVIHIKAGIYDEQITIGRHQKNVFMYGDGMIETVVTNNKSAKFDGLNTMRTATLSALGEGFIAKHMAFSNSAGAEGQQAVALRVQADKAAFLDCVIDGFQHTLYTHTYRQFYRECYISGTIDFIFGDATAIIQNSWIIVRKATANQVNTVTAQARALVSQTTSLVIQNCTIVPEAEVWAAKLKVLTYLGRPWKEQATTVFLENTIAEGIQPEGYTTFPGKEHYNKTAKYYDYHNRGPGALAMADSRVPWPNVKNITKDEAKKFTVSALLQGDTWLKDTKVPYNLGLIT